ncbi:MAG TPA: ribonuclease P protein component [Methylomirabilota bacterium]|nr:ribonuclease P protein component [Methylomirabilota bacterium]
MAKAPAASSLPRGERLRRAADFQMVFQRGSRHERSTFVALWRRAPARRVGFAVSRQVRRAVSRNRARRRIREAYRRVRAQMAPDVEMVLVARPTAVTRPFPELVEDMRRLAEALKRPGPQA